MQNKTENRPRPPRFEGSGILPVDKSSGWTSFDAVNFVRSRFNIPKVGHCGTLDPAATGLLVLVLGKFTSFSQKLSGDNKTYEATLLLGTETDSQDMDGKIIAENDWHDVTEEEIRRVFGEFTGDLKQIPPMVSAVKVNGKRLYELARKGKEVIREPRDITIHRLEITSVEMPYINFTAECSKGTYIRTLCSDIGSALGCGGVLNTLRRTRSGVFDIADAVDIETLKTWEQPELEKFLADFAAKTLIL
ncbi:MAG: tRNA pseudouridine(55) synthase TruB [Victivallaceae bacterium]|nr:tRNA pseudouridine(55) synthase TruB [Victivallaceae bacterium]